MKTLFAAIMILTLQSIAQADDLATPSTTYRSETSDRNVIKTGDLGVGLIIGSTTGIDLKWWSSENSAWRPAVVWSAGNAAVLLDYMYHFRTALSSITSTAASQVLVPYAGLGGIASFGEGNNFFPVSSNGGAAALRVPLGLEFLPHGLPVGVFAEVVPGAGLAPVAFSYFQADVGANYYF